MEKSATQIISSMGHDMRTPLNAIIGYSELLKDEIGDSDPMKADVEKILDAGNTLLKIVDTIVDLCKKDASLP